MLSVGDCPSEMNPPEAGERLKQASFRSFLLASGFLHPSVEDICMTSMEKYDNERVIPSAMGSTHHECLKLHRATNDARRYIASFAKGQPWATFPDDSFTVGRFALSSVPKSAEINAGQRR